MCFKVTFQQNKEIGEKKNSKEDERKKWWICIDKKKGKNRGRRKKIYLIGEYLEGEETTKVSKGWEMEKGWGEKMQERVEIDRS